MRTLPFTVINRGDALIMKPSKNSRRKHTRSEFHSIVNALAKDPSNADALRRLQALKETHFGDVDRDLKSLATEDAEYGFIRQILKTVDQGDWVSVTGPDGNKVQMKSNLWDYIRSRRDRDAQSALAAEHLLRRGIRSLQASPAKKSLRTEQKRSSETSGLPSEPKKDKTHE